MKRRVRWFFFLAALSAAASAAGPQTHEHGRATLGVAIEGRSLSIELEGALENFTGFEHVPRSAAERKTLADALARLRQAERVFALPAAAACRATATAVDDPFAVVAGHVEHEPEHRELRASYQFECALPTALGGLQVRLFEAFPRLARVRATVLGERGQSVVELTRAAPGLMF